MHTRSLRAALLTSLGWIPFACHETEPLPPCGESTAVVRADVATGLYLCENDLLHRPQPVTCASHLPRPLPPAADAGADNETSLSPISRG